MGMFDNIVVNRNFKLPLPHEEFELSEEMTKDLTPDFIYNEEKQTKDLDCSLTTYDLNEDGTITERVQKWSEEEEGLVSAGSNRLVSPPRIINFYIYTTNDKFKYDYCVEWKYTYTENEKKIILEKFEATPNAGRIARSKAFFDELKQREVLLSKWYMQPYCWYVKLIRKLFRLWHRTMNKLPSSHRVERWFTPL